MLVASRFLLIIKLMRMVLRMLAESIYYISFPVFAASRFHENIYPSAKLDIISDRTISGYISCAGNKSKVRHRKDNYYDCMHDYI